ncbi:FtsH protease activity modulator HflK [Oceanomicrobium pacificus]|uniref:Protein HflK n=1 Tax=Oceanomicrobium pacificus TaxID=2692916 RepID=A0A6B0TUT7_9RHOB|nr:FtsH protease activity modulator HflK [Oceanomicrobium pacificus]MXU65535.1 FtsH protease activity modulator HflK [Oceanomicrobium pacificus]
MPYSNNSGGPWGGGGNKGGGGDDRKPEGNRPDRNRPGGTNPPVPDIDDIVRKGQEQLKVLMGGRGGGSGTNGKGPGGDGLGRAPIVLGLLALVGLWIFASFYSVKPEEKSVELFLGEYSSTGESGLNFAPWPIVTAEVLPVDVENTENIGRRDEESLMLTGDENIVDIEFQVVWNIRDPADYLFNLAEPELTIKAVAESAMREVIARSELAPILNRNRAAISQEVRELIQATLDSYESGVNIVRVNFDKADPPAEVIDAFRDVQAASQERDTFKNRADAYANQALARARGEAEQLLQEAEGYRARVVNEAQGEAARFTSVLEEYANAKDVTRKRLYLETMEKVLGDVDKVIIDQSASGGDGQGVVPYLPLNELRRAPQADETGGVN